jgi:hypothetical protein
MHYNHHALPRSPSRRMARKVFIGIVILASSVVSLLVWFDSRRDTSVDDSKNLGQSYEIQKPLEETKTFDEELYSISLPTDWELYRRNENNLFKTNEYRATKSLEDGRTLTVYMDSMPDNFALKLLLPVDVTGDRLAHRPVSSRCEEFTKGAEDRIRDGRAVDVVQAKWDNVEFTCETSAYRFVVGIGEPKTGKLGAMIRSSDGTEHMIFIVYQDATGRPSEQILIDALNSFKMK